MFSTWLSKMLMKLFGIKAENQNYPTHIGIGNLNDYLEETIDNLEESSMCWKT